MGRIIKGKIPIDKITIDNDLYPRVGTFWQSIYKYSENMKAGSKFPPVVLAKFKGQNVLVDGRHRIEANKILKNDSIDSELHIGWDRKKIFEESIKRNISHGLSLSPYEIRKLVLKLRVMKFKDSDISGIVRVPLGKLEKFVAKSAVSAITGKPIGGGSVTEQIIVKTPLRHLAGDECSVEQVQIIEQSQDSLAAKTQISLLEQVVVLMENNLIDSGNQKVQILIDRIKELIKKI
jgi:hypothetical protein